MKVVLDIKGLDCAACAEELNEEILKVSGVSSVNTIFMTQKIELECDSIKTLKKVIDVSNHFEEVQVVTNLEAIVIHIKDLDCIHCASALQRDLLKVNDIISAKVSFEEQTVSLVYCSFKALETAKDIISHFEEVQIVSYSNADFNDEDEITIKVESLSLKTTVKIEGLDCAGCASELEEELAKIPGIKSVSVTFLSQTVDLEYESKEALLAAKDLMNHFEEVKVVENETEVTFKIEGLDCAACASELEEILEGIDGITKATVSFVSSKVELAYISEDALKIAKNKINHFEEVKIVEDPSEVKVKKDYMLILLIVSAVSFLITLALSFVIENELANLIVQIVGYGIAYFTVGTPVLGKTFKSIKRGNFFDENFLMTLASIGAIAITIFSEENELMEAAAVMLLYQLGEYLQAKAVGSSRDTITKLIALKAEEANKIVDGEVVVVAPEELEIGDTILIRVGEKVPVDCIITKGKSAFDTKSLTGEPLPRDYNVGQEVLSGFINTEGIVEAKVTKKLAESAVSKILDMVENSASKKAAPEKFITKFAKYYTPIVCGIAVLIAIFGPVIEGLATTNWNWTAWIIRALSVLVISCPCALIISVPLTYFGGIGACAAKGILVKGAVSLDELAKVDAALFDKTGTLTKGEFTITSLYTKESGYEEFMLSLLGALEKDSNHPVAQPLKVYAGSRVATDVKEVSGMGMKGLINGKLALAGNAKLLKAENIEFDEIDSVSTVIYTAFDGKYIGYAEIDDAAKEGLEDFLVGLKKVGIKTRCMLTGDSTPRANDFAKDYSIDEVYSSLLPENKLEVCQEIKKKHTVLYVGDGINDAPVLVESDCSFSMGQLGSDAAVEASDFVLVEDDLNGIIKAKKISLKTRKLVYENIIGSIAVKVLMMVFATVGLLNGQLWIAVLGDVGVMLLAVLNSLRVRR